MSGRVVQGHDKPHLTGREIEVLQLVAMGHSVDEIARQLFISPLTARRHLERIVFVLVANGSTVREIAQQLATSPATVRQHLGNIRRKGWFRRP